MPDGPGGGRGGGSKKRPAFQIPGRAEGRGASSPATPCSFVGTHHVRHSYCPAGPRDVVLHLPLTLVPSSARTTSAAPNARSRRGTWCFISLQPLFLRRGAPRPAPHFPDRVRGRGASSPATPCFFVLRHHVRRLKHVSRHRMRPDVAKSRFFSINVY